MSGFFVLLVAAPLAPQAHSPVESQSLAAATPRRLPALLPAEKALRERRNEADLDEQPQNSFGGGNDGDWVAQTLHRLEEASTVKAADAQDQGFIPLQRLAGWMDGRGATGRP